MSNDVKKQNSERGITLLITLLTMGVLLSVAASLMFITLKQYQLSGIVYSSEIAFQAATAGVECALYHDLVDNAFDVPGDESEQAIPSSMGCFGSGAVSNLSTDGDGDGQATSGEEQLFRYSWSHPGEDAVCTEISVYKFYDESSDVDVNVPGVVRDINNDGTPDPCPSGSECTVLQSRGYNVACNLIDTAARVVEREYTQVY